MATTPALIKGIPAKDYFRLYKAERREHYAELAREWRNRKPLPQSVYNRNWRQNNAAGRAAHVATHEAIRAGKIERQPCEICGNIKTDAHHDDYAKPLDVRWLCRLHHKAEHA